MPVLALREIGANRVDTEFQQNQSCYSKHTLDRELSPSYFQPRVSGASNVWCFPTSSQVLNHLHEGSVELSFSLETLVISTFSLFSHWDTTRAIDRLLGDTELPVRM